MKHAHQSIHTFVGGEVTERLLGRADIERFSMSAEVAENLIVRPQGPLTRRRGSSLLATDLSPDAFLAAYAPRRDTSEVLGFLPGRIAVFTQPIPDYEPPSTAPLVQYSDDTIRSGAKYGFLGQDGVTRYHSATISGMWTLASPSNWYAGSLGFTRGLFLSEPNIRNDTVQVEDDGPSVPDPYFPMPADFFQFTDLFHVGLDGLVITTETATTTFSSQTLFNLTSTSATCEVTLSSEYTDEMWFEDVLALPASPGTTWGGYGSLSSVSSGTLNIRRSRARFALPAAEMVAGGVYRVNYTLRFTSLSGPVVDTPASFAFTWNGVDSTTTPFYLPDSPAPGVFTIISPSWAT